MALQLMFSRICAVNSTGFMKSPFSAFGMTRSGNDLSVEHDRKNLCFTISLDGEAGECQREPTLRPLRTEGDLKSRPVFM